MHVMGVKFMGVMLLFGLDALVWEFMGVMLLTHG